MTNLRKFLLLRLLCYWLLPSLYVLVCLIYAPCIIIVFIINSSLPPSVFLSTVLNLWKDEIFHSFDGSVVTGELFH